MADSSRLADFLQGRQPDPSMSLEGARQRVSPDGLWGPKTSSNDAFYYLPESKVGDIPYRYQGVALHGALSALPGAGVPMNLGRLLNAMYAGGSVLSGQTDPTPRVQDQLPPQSYSPSAPKF